MKTHIFFLDWLKVELTNLRDNCRVKQRSRYHRSVLIVRCVGDFAFQVLRAVLTEWAHTSRQRDVRDFLINLGKCGRHLPWAPLSESIVEHTGRKQMMVPWPHGALVVLTDLILYDQGGNAAKTRAATCFIETESYEVTFRDTFYRARS